MSRPAWARGIALFAAAIVAASAVWISGCDEEPSVQVPAPRMDILEAPTALLANIDSMYIYRVSIVNTHVDSVSCEVTNPSGQPLDAFAMYDDGGIVVHRNPGYADTLSGDIAAGNGTFTRRINGFRLAEGHTGTYALRFVPPGGSGIPPQTIAVDVQNVDNCLISSAPSAIDFNACFDPIDIFLHVQPSEYDSVENVYLSWGSPFFSVGVLTAVQGDTLWKWTYTPQFFRCYDSDPGNHTVLYEARTRFGMSCFISGQGGSYLNELPVLSNSTLPDTILRPVSPGDTDTVIVTVNLEDCNLTGATDFYGLHFEVRREDRTEWSSASDFYLRDDGTAPDTTAGNGVYTVGLTFNHDASLVNFVYYFRFFGIENFGCTVPYDTSEYLMDSVRVIQPEAASDLPPSNRLGMSTVR